MLLKDLKSNEYFKIVNKQGQASKTIYIKGDYVRALKKYSIVKFEDINFERFIKGTQKVTTDFIF